MKNSICLYLDEDVHPALAPVLRQKIFDVISTQEAGNNGKSDNYGRKSWYNSKICSP
jgi:hypothetical protein